MLQPLRFNLTLSKVLQFIVLVYQTIAVIVFIAALFFASTWLQQPFLGAFFEPTLVRNQSGPGKPSDAWQLVNQGVQHGDHLVSVAGEKVQTARDLERVLSGFFPGETIPVVFQPVDGGSQQTYDVTLHSFPASDRTSYLIVPSIVSFAFFALSLWIFVLRRNEPAGRVFSVFTTSMAIVAGTFFDLYTTHRFSYIWALALPLAGGALVDLTLSFPQEARFVIGRPYLRWGGYVIALFLTGYSYVTMSNLEQPTAYFAAWYASYIFDALAILFHLGVTIYRGFMAQSPVVKSQARVVLIGILFSLGPMGIWFTLYLFGLVSFSPYLFFFVILFPLTIGYTILRYRLIRTDLWLRQGLGYSILSLIAIGGYALLVTFFSLAFKKVMPSNNPYVIGALVFSLIVSLNPTYKRVQNAIDSRFFRGQRVYDQRQRDFSYKLIRVWNVQDIGNILREQITETLRPENIHIYIYDSLDDQYVSLPDIDGRPSSDVRFSANGPLVKYFITENLPLYLDGVRIPEDLKAEEARLNLLDAKLLIGLLGKDSPTGWLALGQRLSKQPYTPQDLTFLENLADQTSVAIGRGQIFFDLERRIQEMNTLTRVSQGVNLTLSFEDVMELIFAQTEQIIPASEFHITLYSRAGDYYYYAFCVEDRERLEEQENIPLPGKLGLGQEVILKGRPILTQDHLRECQARNVTPSFQDVSAWMGVPLNAGAETIGSLEIGSRDASVTYSRAQLGLLQAIADQTAGAIVKARLLEETQQRAYQLSTLNDLTRQLTSTLDLEPLLQSILESAVSILICEAGSLFLVDEQTGELIFKVTVGSPSSAELIGQRIPAGSGVVGRAAQEREPVMENQSKKSDSYFASAEKQIEFTSKSLLAVPLLYKDHVIGVIEVINRKDGLPFVEDDQTLLSAFAGQAAVGIGNARLLEETQQANKELKELDKKKNEFLSIVSHELRTPLTPVQHCIQSMLAEQYGPLTEKQSNRLEIALAKVREETQLINNLLDLARIEDSRESLKLEFHNLAKTINEVITIFNYDAENKKVKLINLVPSSTKINIEIDVVKVKRVITNLVSNAIKFTAAGGEITVSTLVHENDVEVQVKDTGIGIPQDEASKIFERFYQVDTSLTRRVSGTGIGLNIAKTYVELHEGRIWVESILGEGSVFHFTLPLQRKGT